MDKKTAIILGATGLIGKELLQLLLNHESYDEVKVFARKPLDFNHPKLSVHVIDFDNPESWLQLVTGDELFSTFGTTLKKAGSKENQYKIDVSYQFNMAKAAAKNHVKKYILVSSSGANSKSGIFYNHIKGRLEDKVDDLSFTEKIIFRPSVLVGHRQEKRKMELLGTKMLNFINSIGLAKKLKPIKGSIVAKAMVNAANSSQKKNEYTLHEIFDAATKK